MLLPSTPHTAPSPNTALPPRLAHAGQGLVEYALLLALFAILLIPALVFLQDKQSALFERAGNALDGPVIGPVAPGTSPDENVPDTADDCKNGGWQTFNPPGGAFTSQGDCVSWANAD
jgi:Flp pilus assembly pilin Flp